MAIVTDLSILRKVSEPTSREEVERLGLVELIKSALGTAWCPGYGLAAVQVGYLLRMAWYRLPDTFLPTEKILINPIIIQKRIRFFRTGEGCLSIPYRTINTERYMEVVYESDGQRFTAKGLEAVIIQHEVDHMNGLLINDREYRNESVGRNEKCTCGSGIKYKKCCGK